MTPDTSAYEQQLISRLRAGEECAFEEIYREYAAGLTSFVSAKLSSLEEARDIVHDLFVRLWEDRKQVNIISLKAYLYSAAKYKVIDHIRRNMHRGHYASMAKELALSIQADNTLEKNIESGDLRRYLERTLNLLPPRTREIYRLSRSENLNIAAIAKQLSLSDQTVKNQISTALRHLRNSLARLSVILLCWFF